MYEILGILLGALMYCLGLFMAFCPKASTKKEFRENKAKVATTKTCGYIIMACGVVVIILRIFLNRI